MTTTFSFPSHSTHTHLNTGYAAAERVLDVTGYIPGINLLSSAIRLTLALTQLTHGLALSIIATFSHVFAISFNRSNLSAKLMAYNSGYLLKNGFENIFRALITSIPVLGSLLAIYDSDQKSKRSERLLGEQYGFDVTNLEIHRPFIGVVEFLN